MVKFSASTSLLLALIIVCISGKAMVPLVGACHVSVEGGGCPDVKACGLTCTPCYRGVGRVTNYCRDGGKGYPSICVCEFSEGAPCLSDCTSPPPGATILTNETHA